MGLGSVGMVLGALLGTWPGLLGVLALLGWAAGQACSLAWDVIKDDRDMAASLLGMPLLQ